MTKQQLATLSDTLSKLNSMAFGFESLIGIDYDPSVSPNVVLISRHGLDNYFDVISPDGEMRWDKSEPAS